ncbi:MAG TPA: ABC transporter ATP-binding protein [Candidatus Saccharimonadales bacterium]|jgi:ABC-2 type transport system ATP-binding protein|nr:ABC transporter ATP-binding protein [Candidatus Saccharimonadales bacterium]
MNETASPVIELQDLVVNLGQRTILNHLSGSLSGRCIGLLGPNGSGKSTLINTLLGFYPPASGSARIYGRDIQQNIKELRALIGYMPESDSFIADMSGIRFVRYMAEISGLPPREAMERAHEAFFYVGLGEARYRKVGTYSLGMKQLVKLAQALAHGPKLLLLDEPTNGLDPEARTRMLQLVREIRDAGGVNVLISSHLLHDIEECCDEVIILKDGKIAAICNLEEERKANLKFLELEISQENGFVEAIAALGCETARFSGGRLKIVLPEAIEVGELYRLAVEHTVQIRRMNYRRDSLEDIFLRAMEGPQPAKLSSPPPPPPRTAHGSL